VLIAFDSAQPFVAGLPFVSDRAGHDHPFVTQQHQRL
jgi:hypothetical protein